MFGGVRLDLGLRTEAPEADKPQSPVRDDESGGRGSDAVGGACGGARSRRGRGRGRLVWLVRLRGMSLPAPSSSSGL